MIDNVWERFYDLILNFGPKLPQFILAVIIGYILIKVAIVFLRRLFKLLKFNKAMIDLSVSLSSIVLWVLLASELARQLGLNSLALTISGSVLVLGFAVANGATNLTSDIIAGLFLAKDRDFESGYRIKTGDIEGVVDKIDVRKVRIKDDKGNIHVVPNSKLDTAGWMILDRNN